MHLPPPPIRMSLGGFSRVTPPPMVPVELTRCELHILARAIEREANDARTERQDLAADRLDRRACDLREAAR